MNAEVPLEHWLRAPLDPCALRRRWQESWDSRRPLVPPAIPADDDAFGGLALQQVLRPRHHTPPPPTSPPASPPPSPPPPRDDDVNEWGGGLGEILVPRRRNPADSSAYEPLPRRRRDDMNDWAGTSLDDVLVTHRRPTPDASASAPPRRPSRENQSWSLGDVFARRRPIPAPRAAAHAPSNRRSSDYMRDDELTYESLLALDHRLPSPPAVVAARKKLIARVVKAVAYDAARAAASNKCVVCLDDFRDKDRLKQLPCGHLFHGPCVCKWLEQDPRCPTCRQPIGTA